MLYIKLFFGFLMLANSNYAFKAEPMNSEIEPFLIRYTNKKQDFLLMETYDGQLKVFEDLVFRPLLKATGQVRYSVLSSPDQQHFIISQQVFGGSSLGTIPENILYHYQRKTRKLKELGPGIRPCFSYNSKSAAYLSLAEKNFVIFQTDQKNVRILPYPLNLPLTHIQLNLLRDDHIVYTQKRGDGIGLSIRNFKDQGPGESYFESKYLGTNYLTFKSSTRFYIAVVSELSTEILAFDIKSDLKKENFKKIHGSSSYSRGPFLVRTLNQIDEIYFLQGPHGQLTLLKENKSSSLPEFGPLTQLWLMDNRPYIFAREKIWAIGES